MEASPEILEEANVAQVETASPEASFTKPLVLGTKHGTFVVLWGMALGASFWTIPITLHAAIAGFTPSFLLGGLAAEALWMVLTKRPNLAFDFNTGRPRIPFHLAYAGVIYVGIRFALRLLARFFLSSPDAEELADVSTTMVTLILTVLYGDWIRRVVTDSECNKALSK